MEPLNEVPEDIFSPLPIVSDCVVLDVISILADPSKLTPFIVLAVANLVAVEELPFNAPENVVAESVPDDGTNVKLTADTFKSLFPE